MNFSEKLIFAGEHLARVREILKENTSLLSSRIEELDPTGKLPPDFECDLRFNLECALQETLEVRKYLNLMKSSA